MMMISAENGVYTKSFQVKFSDIGAFEQVKLASLFDYLQEIAGEHAAQLGVTSMDLQEQNLAWMLYRYDVRITRYPRWEERVKLYTWRYPHKNLYALRAFEMTDMDGTRLLEARTSWLAINLDTHKPVRLNRYLPPHFFDTSRKIDATFASLPSVNQVEWSLPFRVLMHDLDLNRHVNNTVYVKWAVETMPESVIRATCPVEIEVMFLDQALYGDRVVSQTQAWSESEHSDYLHRIVRESDQKELTRLRTRWRREE